MSFLNTESLNLHKGSYVQVLIPWNSFSLPSNPKIRAAHLSLPPDSKHRIYSIQGNYLGPTASDRPVKIRITSLRQTRTFITRLVLLSQDFDGKQRSCLSCIVDFYVSSGSTMLKYSTPPSHQVTHHSKLQEISEHLESLVKKGEMTRVQADTVSSVELL